MQTIVVISNQKLWNEAQKIGLYTQSTIESALNEVGFIHCTNPEQTVMIANRHFTQYNNLLLLLIDSNKVTAKVVFEESQSGRGGVYPHIYGPLNTDAVYEATPLCKRADGQFSTPKELQSQIEQDTV